jgi:hypothetical protein
VTAREGRQSTDRIRAQRHLVLPNGCRRASAFFNANSAALLAHGPANKQQTETRRGNSREARFSSASRDHSSSRDIGNLPQSLSETITIS